MPAVTIVVDLPRSAEAGLRAEVGKAVRRAAFKVQAWAQLAAPVDTGFLRRSIKVEQLGDLTSMVSVGAEYGIYVEMGFHHYITERYIEGRPYFLPAVGLGERYLQTEINRILKK